MKMPFLCPKAKCSDPILIYPGYPGMEPITPNLQRSIIGNLVELLTDMTLQGAARGELARVIYHSMVVIYAEQYNLNWKQSAIDHGIAALETKYQPSENGEETSDE